MGNQALCKKETF